MVHHLRHRPGIQQDTLHRVLVEACPDPMPVARLVHRLATQAASSDLVPRLMGRLLWLEGQHRATSLAEPSYALADLSLVGEGDFALVPASSSAPLAPHVPHTLSSLDPQEAHLIRGRVPSLGGQLRLPWPREVLRQQVVGPRPRSGPLFRTQWAGLVRQGVFRGHLKAVTGLAFDPTCTRLVTGGGDGLVKVWAEPEGFLCHTIHTVTEIVDVAVSPDARLIAVVGKESRLRLFALETGAPVAVLAPPRRDDLPPAAAPGGVGDSLLMGVVFTSGGVLVAVTGNATVAVYNTAEESLDRATDVIALVEGFTRDAGGEDAGVFGAAPPLQGSQENQPAVFPEPTCLSVDPTEQLLAVGTGTGSVHLLQLGAKPGSTSCLQVLYGHSRGVTCIAFANTLRRGTRLASSSVDGSLRVWFPASRTARRWHSVVLRLPDSVLRPGGGRRTAAPPIYSFQWAVGDERLVAVDRLGAVSFWHVGKASLLRRVVGAHSRGPLFIVEVNPCDSTLVFTAGQDGVVKLWDARTGDLIASPPAWVSHFSGQVAGLTEGRWSPDGLSIVLGNDRGEHQVLGVGARVLWSREAAGGMQAAGLLPVGPTTPLLVVDDDQADVAGLVEEGAGDGGGAPAPPYSQFFLNDYNESELNLETGEIVEAGSREPIHTRPLGAFCDNNATLHTRAHPLTGADDFGPDPLLAAWAAQSQRDGVAERRRVLTHTPHTIPLSWWPPGAELAPLARARVESAARAAPSNSSSNVRSATTPSWAPGGQEEVTAVTTAAGASAVESPAGGEAAGSRRRRSRGGRRSSGGEARPRRAAAAAAQATTAATVMFYDDNEEEEMDNDWELSSAEEVEAEEDEDESDGSGAGSGSGSEEDSSSSMRRRGRRPRTRSGRATRSVSRFDNSRTRGSTATPSAAPPLTRPSYAESSSSDEEDDEAIARRLQAEEDRRAARSARVARPPRRTLSSDDDESGGGGASSSSAAVTPQRRPRIPKRAAPPLEAPPLPPWSTALDVDSEPYVPQRGEHIVYLRQGHEEAMTQGDLPLSPVGYSRLRADHERESDSLFSSPAYFPTPPYIAMPALPATVLCRIDRVAYIVRPLAPRQYCRISLTIISERPRRSYEGALEAGGAAASDGGGLRSAGGRSSTVGRHLVVDYAITSGAPFIVSHRRYAEAVGETWLGAEVSMLFMNDEGVVSRALGSVENQGPFDAERFPDSPWNSLSVRWAATPADPTERVSPWELVLEAAAHQTRGGRRSRPVSAGALPVRTHLPEAEAAALADYFSALVAGEGGPRRVSGLAVVTQPHFELFAAPVSREEFPQYTGVVPCPMDMGTVVARLRGGWYANHESLEDDVRLIAGNAEVFNGETTVVSQVARQLVAVALAAVDGAVLPEEALAGAIAREEQLLPPTPSARAGAAKRRRVSSDEEREEEVEETTPPRRSRAAPPPAKRRRTTVASSDEDFFEEEQEGESEEEDDDDDDFGGGRKRVGRRRAAAPVPTRRASSRRATASGGGSSGSSSSSAARKRKSSLLAELEDLVDSGEESEPAAAFTDDDDDDDDDDDF